MAERRNFDFAILLAVMAMPAVKAVEKATGGLIYVPAMGERKRRDRILT